MIDPLAPVLAFLDAHWMILWAFVIGANLGALFGFRGLSAAYADHQDTLKQMAILLGHFEGAAEVVAENGLTEEAVERGNRYAQENVIDLTHPEDTDPTLLDRVRARLPFYPSE